MDFWIITIDMVEGTRLTTGPFLGVERAREYADQWAGELDGWVGISVTKILFDHEVREQAAAIGGSITESVPSSADHLPDWRDSDPEEWQVPNQ